MAEVFKLTNIKQLVISQPLDPRSIEELLRSRIPHIDVYLPRLLEDCDDYDIRRDRIESLVKSSNIERIFIYVKSTYVHSLHHSWPELVIYYHELAQLSRENFKTIEVSIEFLDQGIGPEFMYTLLSEMSIKKLYVSKKWSTRLSEMEIVNKHIPRHIIQFVPY